jgi:hypothetical protein
MKEQGISDWHFFYMLKWKKIYYLHWTLDMTFREDEQRKRAKHAAKNFAIVRKIELNLLKKDSGFESLHSKRLKVAWNKDFLLHLIHVCPARNGIYFAGRIRMNILLFNMRRFICVTLLMLCLSGLNAQDDKNPEVQSNDSIYVLGIDTILLQRINPEDMFRRKIVTIDSSSFDSRKIRKQLIASYPDFKRWRFGVNGGAELIIAPKAAGISEELSKYKQSLKTGARFGIDALFFVSPNIGVGLNYSTYNANGKIDYITYESNDVLYEGARRDDIRIHFFGPTISIRSIPKNNKWYAFCDFILGYFYYSNHLTLNNTDERYLQESNFGFSTSVGVDFMFMKDFSVGVSLNIMAASIKNADILNGDDVENLSRIGLVMTLKIYK